MITKFFRRTGESLVALVRGGWLGVMIARMNKWPLLDRAGIGTFLKRMPVLGPLKMASLMLVKPRTRSWTRTGAVLRQYVEDEQRLRKSGL